MPTVCLSIQQDNNYSNYVRCNDARNDSNISIVNDPIVIVSRIHTSKTGPRLNIR